MKRVGVLDYGMGNLRSVAKSFEEAGARVVVSDSVPDLSRSELLVVPGVGAFDAAMDVLRTKGLDRFIRRWVEADKPYFGICLGLQLLFDGSEEAPGTKGLGLLRGRVKKFRFGRSLSRLKVPHMGWNEASPQRRAEAMTAALPKPDFFYFVHSFYPEPVERSVVWTETAYGRRFCSAVARGRLAATQFHPEKSGEKGLLFLKRLLKSVPEAC
ncbi:MAG: imidazole glycerol phosphate synthase subunit HisH [Elusimicrobia bacterium]|nr:imidazole glycerol phosphate synthase subunit HisH [Elusimicrobiota bacterium]